MALFRDPLVRELLYGDLVHPTTVALRPFEPVRAPVRVQRQLQNDWPLGSFDHALNDLQAVMDNMNQAIGQYHSSLTKDLAAGGMKTTRTEDGNLQLAFDVAQFKPEEVNVKICDDNLVVEAKTETSENDSYHKAEFKRWVKLPQDVKHESIKSTWTPNRKLVIEVPMNKPIENSRSRSIPITVQKEAVEGAKAKQGNAGDQQQAAKK